jgi:hypothetical protein
MVPPWAATVVCSTSSCESFASNQSDLPSQERRSRLSGAVSFGPISWLLKNLASRERMA